MVCLRFAFALGLGVWLLIACQAPVPQPPTNAQALQLAWGEAVFQWQCARCHADDRVVPLTPERLVLHHDALRLAAYNAQYMPLDSPSSLPEQDYWDVTAYTLAVHGLLPADLVLGPDTAELVNFLP
jgi:mono/diheme cytochrome c family protein